MKNIHILPTDKPSRLSIIDSQLIFSKEYYVNPQNIYITSDEEIKEDYSWCYRIGIGAFKAYKKDKHPYDYAKKIILTTDQDLIKDGVQAIDDEFLEWFVKNPSCEEVETEYCSFWGYKSIIPKEEPNYNSKLKIKWISNNPQCRQIESCYNFLSKKCICSKEEPDYTALLQQVGTKQETLEEYFLGNIKNVLQFGNDAQAIRFMEKYYQAKKEQDEKTRSI